MEMAKITSYGTVSTYVEKKRRDVEIDFVNEGGRIQVLPVIDMI